MRVTRWFRLSLLSALVLTACADGSESALTGEGGGSDLKGIWERSTGDGSGDETDIAIGLVEGEPPNRVWACEVRPKIPAIILQRGTLTGNRIKWDAVHGGVPDYIVGRSGSRLWVDVDYPGATRTHYSRGTWNRFCPKLEDTRIFVLFTMTGGPGATLTSASSSLACAGSPVPNQRYGGCSEGPFTYSITASNGLSSTNVPAVLSKPAEGMRRIYSVGYHWQPILNRYLVGAHYEDVSHVGGRIEMHEGDGQTAERRTTVPVRPAARVVTPDGKPVVGATVHFRVVEGEGHIEAEGFFGTSVALTTDSSGVARVENWRLGPDLGRNRITASALDMTGSPVSFIANAVEDRLVTVHGGWAYSCALSQASRLYCWGGGALHGNYPGDYLPSEASSSVRLTTMAAGDWHACGLTTTGQPLCWGTNTYGQRGAPASTSAPPPELVSTALRFTQVTAGMEHTCALTSAGVAYCWGDNRNGKLGDGTTVQRSAPTQVSGALTFQTISAGQHHTCGITTGGDAYCWGLNAVNTSLTSKAGGGALGDGTRTNRSVPTLVSGSHKFKAIAAGRASTCAIRTDGLAFCWGDNTNGVLGTPSSATDLLTPTQVRGSTSFAEVRLGEYHACARTDAGALYCWGSNTYGALGHSLTPLTPGQVAGTYSQFTTGFEHTCAVNSTDLKVYCWGRNHNRQLGLGSNAAFVSVPTMISDVRHAAWD
jgi:hypothetical protein